MNTNSSLTSEQWLYSAHEKLEAAGIPTPRLDCLVLLEDALGKDRSWLLAHPEYALRGSPLQKVNAQVERRVKHEPLAYIRGKSEFYGREFIVTPDTLEPRPETETIIDLLKSLYKVEPCTVIDVGTGSGCLAITAKLEFPRSEVIAIDISEACLKIAHQNAKKLGAKVTFLHGDLLQPVQNAEFHQELVILANLPYVPDSHTINQAAMFEPKMAIFGGTDGLDLYRRLFDQIANNLQKPRYIFTESLPFQHEKLAVTAKQAGYMRDRTADFIQSFRLAA